MLNTLKTVSSHDDLFHLLEDGALLLTVNNRLAQRYMADYAQWQSLNGKTVWLTPQVLPLNTWLSEQMNRLSDAGQHQLLTLSDHQEKQLWNQIIEPDAYDLYMMPSISIARQVQQAWQLIQQWQLPAAELRTSSTPETEALLHWSKKFETLCKKNDWISQTRLIVHITQALHDQNLSAPGEQLIIAGFEDPNTLHQQFFTGLHETGVTLSRFIASPVTQTIHIKACTDFIQELDAATEWAKDILTHDPDTKLAVVIPTLNENRKIVHHQFTRKLHPERITAPPFQYDDLFNISLGEPLSQTPVVFDALLCLNLLKPVIPTEEISNLLTATYLFKAVNENAVAIDIEQRALIDVQLRNQGRRHWSLKALISYLHLNLAEDVKASGQQFIVLLESLLSHKQQNRSKQSPDAWVSFFNKTWELLGWPGARTLNSHEYQQYEKTTTLLEQYRQLIAITPELELQAAITQLKQLAADTVFQPQTQNFSVQVSGTLEAAGQQYDGIWIMGLDDQSYPASSNPNPFIPILIQQQYNLPHSSSQRDIQYAREQLKQFIANSQQVVLSYPLQDNDRELRPSALLSQLNIEPERYKTSQQQNAASLNDNVEFYQDENLAPLAQSTVVKGGTALLTQQAVCPFMATASFRLNAEQITEIAEGVNPMDWGKQVHEALEIIWKKLKTQTRLLNSTEDELDALIRLTIDNILGPYQQKRPDLYQAHFIELEKNKLQKIIHNWLALEKQRPAHFTVVETEQDQTLQVGGLVLRAKVDRIDQLDSGERILLDYKTGRSSSSKSWLSEVITEPQLPLYSTVENEQLCAVALAKLNEKQCQFNGIANHDDLLPGIKAFVLPEADDENLDHSPDNPDHDDWNKIRNHWQINLENLAQSFRQGLTLLNTQNCIYCSYPALCRKHEIDSHLNKGRQND